MTTMDVRSDRGRGRREAPARTTDELRALFDRLPPHSPEAEMCLLGSMLLDPNVIGEVLTLVSRREQFYQEKHAAVYDAVVGVYDKHNSGDLVQIVQALRDAGNLEGAGGPEYLVQLVESVPSAANAVHYARIVAEKHKLRRLIEAAGRTIWESYQAGGPEAEGAQEVIDNAARMVFEIALEAQAGDPERLAELLQIEYERLLHATEHDVSGLRTHFADLDEMLGGLQAGEMIVVAARPSMGKTALALNMAEQVALGGVPRGPGTGAPTPIGVFSLEMSKSAVVQRLISARAGVSSHDLRSGRLGHERVTTSVMHACDELREAPMYIDDTPGLNITQLRARARRMVQQHTVKAVVIDYLQLMSAPNAARESRQVEVSAISRGVKALARELRIPVICLSQLNRASEHREGNRPRMSDLRESGSIEQDADVVLLLHREDYYHVGDDAWLEENADKRNLAEIIVAKQRNGPTGTVRLVWDPQITRFKDHDRYAEAGSFGDARARAPEEPWGMGGTRHGTAPRRSAFAPPPAGPTGPVQDFRDGGGPDRSEEGEPPF